VRVSYHKDHEGPIRNEPTASEITNHEYADHWCWSLLSFRSVNPIEENQTNPNTRAGEKTSASLKKQDRRMRKDMRKQKILKIGIPHYTESLLNSNSNVLKIVQVI